MIIAIASNNNMVTEHFGHCECFYIFEVEKKEIMKKQVIPNPGHRPGFLPEFLIDKGVNVIISGGMGESAINIFNKNGIEVITGALGKTLDVLNQYLEGLIKSNEYVCHSHLFHNQCGN